MLRIITDELCNYHTIYNKSCYHMLLTNMKTKSCD